MVQARLCWLLAAVLFPFITFAQVLAADKTNIVVPMDQAMVVSFPPAADIVLLGDPFIADIQWLHFSGGKLLALILAKGYGDTNVIAFDKDGHVLTDAIIHVTFPTDKDLVLVYSGTDRETLSCTPNPASGMMAICSPRVTLGDSNLTKTMTDTGTHDSTISGAAKGTNAFEISSRTVTAK